MANYQRKQVKNLKELMSPMVYRRSRIRRTYTSGVRQESAAKCIGKLDPGCEIFGFTKGQFSAIDVIEYCLGQTGPADVFIATWSAAAADIKAAHQFLKDGRIRSLRFLVDYSFQSRKPEFCKELISIFGQDAIRVTVIHGKFISIGNDDWHLVVRTSMNLNYNPRFENFEISDDAGMYQFLGDMVDEIWASQNAADGFKMKPSENVKEFKRSFQDQTAIYEQITDARDIL